MSKDTNRTSMLTEGKVLAALVGTGYCVSVPFGVARYDLLIDVNGEIKRIQCKTGIFKNGSIEFRCTSVHNVGGKIEHKGYLSESDFFAVYCPELDKVYIVPVSKSTRMNLKVETPKPGGKLVWPAEKFEIERFYRNPELWEKDLNAVVA